MRFYYCVICQRYHSIAKVMPCYPYRNMSARGIFDSTDADHYGELFAFSKLIFKNNKQTFLTGFPGELKFTKRQFEKIEKDFPSIIKYWKNLEKIYDRKYVLVED